MKYIQYTYSNYDFHIMKKKKKKFMTTQDN